MVVDFEAAWNALAVAMVNRQGIGRDGLFALMKRIEVENTFEEEIVERLLRQYGVLFREDLRAAARDDHSTSGDGPSGGPGAAPRTATEDGPEHQPNQEVHDVGPDHDYGYRAGRGGRGSVAV